MPDLTLKEIISALIAVSIAAVTLWLIYRLYLSTTSAAVDFQKASQILGIAVALMGTVTGYYFGRIPAEAHAAGMQQVATTAQQVSRDAQAQAADSARQAATSAAGATTAIAAKDKIVNQVQSLRDRLSASPAGGGAPRPPEVDFVVGQLDQILRG